MTLNLKAGELSRLEFCRNQFNSFTKSNLTPEQYLCEILTDALMREECIALISSGVGVAHASH